MLDTVMSMTVSAVMASSALWFSVQAMSDIRTSAIASQFQQIRNAAEAYIIANIDDVLLQTTSGSSMPITATDRFLPLTFGEQIDGGQNSNPDVLIRGYADLSLSGQTVYGDQIRALVRRRNGSETDQRYMGGCFANDPSVLYTSRCFEVVIFTIPIINPAADASFLIPANEAWTIASRIGIEGGASCPPDPTKQPCDTTRATGTNGRWTLQSNYFASALTGWNPFNPVYMSKRSLFVLFTVASAR